MTHPATTVLTHGPWKHYNLTAKMNSERALIYRYLSTMIVPVTQTSQFQFSMDWVIYNIGRLVLLI